MNYHKILNSTTKFIKRNAPSILTYVGMAGVVTTSVLTGKASFKAARKIDNLKKHEEEPTKLDIVKEVGPLYIPAIISGSITIACCFGSNLLNKKQQSQILGAYACLKGTYEKYRQAAKNVYGDNADEQIFGEMAKISKEDVPISMSSEGKTENLPIDEDERVLFYDTMSDRYFNSTIAAVYAAEYHLNRRMALTGSVTLNEFYDLLGISNVIDGDFREWSIGEGYMWVDFDHKLTVYDDGLECYILSCPYEPCIDCSTI